MYKLLSKIIIFCFSVIVPPITFGFNVTGDEVNLSGNITSVVLTEEGGVLNVVSDNEIYGKTWEKKSSS